MEIDWNYEEAEILNETRSKMRLRRLGRRVGSGKKQGCILGTKGEERVAVLTRGLKWS